MSTRGKNYPRRYKRYNKNPKAGKHLNKTQKSDVKKILEKRSELKYLNFNPNAITAVIAPNIVNLTSGIAQGLTDNARIGDTLRLHDFHLSCFFNTNDGLRNRVRYILFQWKENSTPTSADILLLGTTGVENFTSQLNHDKRHLYRILLDKSYDMVGSGQGTADPYQDSSQQIRKHHIRNFPWKDVNYIAATTNGYNQLYFMIMGDQNSTSGVNFYWTGKLTYTDT